MEIDISQVIERINIFFKKNPDWVIFIRWPTTSWKTNLSIKLADFFDVEIISADSRQIFKFMDIWTDKISKEIQQKVPHHLIDIIEPDQNFTAWERRKQALEKIFSIKNRKKLPLVVGGTGLYIDTIYKNFDMPAVEPDWNWREKMQKLEDENPWYLWERLNSVDPISACQIHKNSTRYLIRALEIFEKTGQPKSKFLEIKKPPFPILMIGIFRSGDEINSRIEARIDEMLNSWLIQEVESLLRKYDKNLQSMQWIWYKEIADFLTNKITLAQAREQMIINTRQLGKRQRTWFRRYLEDEKNGREGVEFYHIFLD